jgi:hypothetical protein
VGAIVLFGKNGFVCGAAERPELQKNEGALLVDGFCYLQPGRGSALIQRDR